MTRSLLLLGDAGGLARRMAPLAGELGLVLAQDGDHPPPPSELAVVVVDLARPRALEELASWRQQAPEAVLVAHLAAPDRTLWESAERLGCDLVTNRGALLVRLRARLSGGTAPSRRLCPLFDASEVAGRLGLVQRVATTPVGPVAVYQVGGTLSCLEDVCPHGGATVSEGELDGLLLTCPGHGSRFDVATGERLRGPADCALRRFEVTEREGRIQLLWR